MLSFIFLLLLFNNSLVVRGEEYKVTKQIFLDVEIDRVYLGRIVIGLFGEIAPKTVSNFYKIATKGINGKNYTGTIFHRVVDRFVIQGGDLVYNNGSGSISIYGKSFDDETFDVKHNRAGLVSMANSGSNTNGCQFFITTITTPWLDGKHVAFGMVVKGQNHVHKIEHIKTDSEYRPKLPVRIKKSGAIPTPSPFYVSDNPYHFKFLEIIYAGAVPLTMTVCILAFFHYVLRKLKHFENLKLHDL